jgi:predicted MFS family arabinose efflux permease
MERTEPPRNPNVASENVVPTAVVATAPSARQWRLPKTFMALRHRNYRLFMGGQLISIAGTWIQTIAQGWLVYQISGSELALGIVGFAAAIPALIASPFAGVVTDHVPRRTLLIATQSGAMLLAFILATLTFLNVVQVWHVVLLAAGLGLVNAFDGPARQAFVVEMVGRDDMPNAIALNSMTFNSGRIIGPAIGGTILVWLGAGWCFLLNGISFFAVIIGLLMMSLPPHKASVHSLSPWKQMASALSYLRNEPELQALLLTALAFSLFGISYSTVLPAFVDKVLGQGAAAFGTINAMSGIGAVTGAFLIANWGDRGYRGRWLSWALLAFPLMLSAFALNRHYPTAMVLAILLGCGFMVTYTLINTLLQTQLADDMRGRVMSLYTITFYGFTPFGNLLIGSLSEWIGLSQALVFSAVVCLLTTGAVLLWIPAMRKLK